jgi:glycosyltransferase involved in cell wall biosynthesis
MMPLVSILIPVFNCEAWITDAIESALAQTWPNKEVIVLDDGSTDGTLDVVQRFGSKIKFKSYPRGGQNVSRNRLTELSHGDWLVFLDADDELASDSVELKMRYAEKADVIYGSMEIATFAGRTKTQSSTNKAIDFEDPFAAAFDMRLPNTSAVMVKREALSDVGGWPTDVDNFTDYALYFELLLAKHRFKAAPDAFSLYRKWSHSQAVHENRLRTMVTHLDVLWKAADKLESAGGMTPLRRKAWSERTLTATRTLYHLDKNRVALQLKRLDTLNPGFLPNPPAFPREYAWTFRWLGFYAAERLASIMRPWRRKLAG